MASPSQTSKESPAPLKRGDYHPPTSTDLRSPCPIVNAFANHGLIPRDGRNVHPADLDTAMQDLGLSLPLRKTLLWGTFFERQDQLPATFKDYLTNPFAYLHWHFGIRPRGQQQQQHTPYIHLDQLSRHGALEHDVSMTRRDSAQQAAGADNHSPQPDLIAQLLNSSTDGSYLTTADFAALRRKRLEQQRRDNPALCFPWILHFVAAGQIAAVQRVFGQGERVPVGYAEAIFREERLPVEEGWRKKGGWGLGVLGVVVQQVRVRWGIGKAMG
ncbi:MAG: hypothetical protein L6R36_003243 [Xanthoria steineri]|nr:MAG: hypothetical protein L6R36_003243 [Xanthoria steineri]